MQRRIAGPAGRPRLHVGPACPAVATTSGGALGGRAVLQLPVTTERRRRRQREDEQQQGWRRADEAHAEPQPPGAEQPQPARLAAAPTVAAAPAPAAAAARHPTPGSRRRLLGRARIAELQAAAAEAAAAAVPEAAPAADAAPSAAAAARRLTGLITSAQSWRDLERVLFGRRQPEGGLNAIHASAALSRLAKLLPKPEAAGARDAGVQQLLLRLEALVASLLAPHVAQGPAQGPAAAAAGGSERRRQQPNQQQQPTQQQQQQQAVALQPQQLATIVWAWGTMRHRPDPGTLSLLWRASVSRLGRHTPQELAMTVWGIGRLRQRPPPDWMAAFEAASRHRMWAFKPQELAMALWGLAELGLSPGDAWWSEARAAALAKAPGFSPRDAAQVLWAVAALRAPGPREWADGLLGAAAARGALPLFSARDASNSVWALARLSQQQGQGQGQERQQQQHAHPGSPAAAGESAFAGWALQLLAAMSRSNVKLASATMRDHANILWGLAALRLQPPAEWAAEAWRATGDALARAAPVGQQQEEEQQQQRQQQQRQQQQRQQQQQQQRQEQEQEQEQQLWRQRQGQHTEARGPWGAGPPQPAGASHQGGAAAGACSSVRSSPGEPGWRAPPPVDERDAAHLAWAAAAMQQQPGPSWLAALWRATLPALPSYGAQAAATLLWASARLGGRPPMPWTAAALGAVRRDLANLQPQGACMLLWALAALGHRPSSGFMRDVLARLQLELHLLPPAGFAGTLGALGALRYCPGGTWWDACWYCLAPAVPEMGSRELCGVACGAAVLGWAAPPASAAALGARAARVLPAAGPGPGGRLLLALGRLGWRPGAGAEGESLLRACAALLCSSGSTSSGSTTSGSGDGVGSSGGGLDPPTARDVVRILCGVRRLGLAPDAGWLEAARRALLAPRASPSPRDAAAALVELSALGAAAPDAGWLGRALDALLAPTAGGAEALPPSLLDAAAAALAAWPGAAPSEAHVRGLLAARVAARAAAAAEGRAGGPGAFTVPADAMAAWEALAARCAGA
ncbi:hypothetical protein Rsub_09526 [Raphidocelis subcapitata]|uniref:Tbc2 translation factor, chloroplastic n=1 Tax=Raphidocelis subcapitata TaxID=307507 RepID=A0A2V0PGL6_9CHLO|nr:hypothetical protein Rsub_09526 [Raphidocelis subcapitata]|eukprot:GBF97053.1 hypothetical protein Rsub_09526 [Raphidocelis subcapitata]